MAHHALQAFAIIGCIWSVYFSARIIATIADFFMRWRKSRSGDPDAWKVDGEE